MADAGGKIDGRRPAEQELVVAGFRNCYRGGEAVAEQGRFPGLQIRWLYNGASPDIVPTQRA